MNIKTKNTDKIGNRNMNIKTTNTEAISSYLREINGRAREHTLAERDVRRIAEDAEAQLAVLKITRRNRTGAIVIFAPELGLPHSYKYSVITTRIVLRRFSDGGWRLMSAERYDTSPSDRGIYRLELPAAIVTAAKDAWAAKQGLCAVEEAVVSQPNRK
jgi:hypothetical protein